MAGNNPVKITETVLRDGHQSICATRMRINDMLPVLEQLDEVGSWNNHRNTPTAQAGNSPVTPDGWQLVPKEPTAAMNKAGWAAMNEHDAINPTYRAMLAAAPQQEVKSALEHGMQRYAGAMQKLSEGDK